MACQDGLDSLPWDRADEGRGAHLHEDAREGAGKRDWELFGREFLGVVLLDWATWSRVRGSLDTVQMQICVYSQIK